MSRQDIFSLTEEDFANILCTNATVSKHPL